MEHKILNWLEHIWPLMSGIAITIMAVFRLWWYDKKVVKKRIATLESLAEHMATQDDLRECREGVDKQDADNLKVVLDEIKTGERRNDEKHNAILKDMNVLHQKTMETMLELHSSDK